MAKSFDNINRLVVGELDISQDQKKSYKITMTGDALKFLNRSNSSETFVLNKDGSFTLPTAMSSSPDSPASGGVVFTKSDGKLYFKNSSGTEYNLTNTDSGDVVFNEVVAASLDISGDVDIDGTLEADAITVNSTALDTHIAGVTVTNATNATKAYITSVSNNSSHIIVFADAMGDYQGLQGDTGFKWNPSTNCLGIGVASPKVPVDIDNMGGLTIAETYIHNTSAGTGASTKHEISTSYQNFNNHAITFTAPANGKVKVKFIAMFTGIDSSVGSNAQGEEIYVRIYDSGASSYITDISGVVWNGNKFMQTDESGNHMQVIEANVDGLTAGTSYTYQFSFKKGAADTDTNISFGADFPPVIIRAETLGNVTAYTS